MKAFREIDPASLDSVSLKEEMDLHGYVLVRNLLPREILGPLLKEITDVLYVSGWLLPDSNPIDRIANVDAACSDGDPVYKKVYDYIFGLRSFHAMPHSCEAQRVMKMLVGEQLLIHPKSAARLIFPNFGPGVIHAHQDHTAVAGDAETFTAWMPLHNCPEELGPLCILQGSHRYGLQSTVGQTGYIAAGTEHGDDWVGGTINSGDLLLFHSLTVHKAAPNRSSQLRISLDCRFQSYLKPVNPGTLVFTGSGRRSWEKVYAHWPKDKLKYYWKALPLQLKPSKIELSELARTSHSLETRERYARILERLDAELPLLTS
ncbi:ectoine hydroxylase-related dioxygenase (phytanoyl-CoA dioxygenase family) [Granulicella aggregans]|uniref:Ectoine hydroxylase-related dioxygenase (Phytanoyl-CoA dioxygenase family) n=1 Tax=Granulicella aggregans TaxID=474949 RepID=A0A7W7Z9W1_9BACT|nr:phytanoyl-CoA dioxygenase family protein [Granulicella aggregans]MBB5056016.1 ectoine hydroxylase-related dioxygenase (phytanoyl-CoA dioxygenase family) [Granulicella aggregans]